jgi:hypothetical protein
VKIRLCTVTARSSLRLRQSRSTARQPPEFAALRPQLPGSLDVVKQSRLDTTNSPYNSWPTSVQNWVICVRAAIHYA